MFKIVLTNNIEDTELIFKVRETSIAKKWFAELCKNYSIYENDRFSNWGANYELINDINKQIDIISIDIDGEDYEIFKSIKMYLPKLFIIEI
jgi:hypothetical protein